MRVRSLFTLALLAVLPLSAASETKGKFYFKKTCKACHTQGGAAKAITPLSKTQAQWKKFFQGAKHGKDPLSKHGTPEQLQDIEAFLVGHASDSPQPETCGG